MGHVLFSSEPFEVLFQQPERYRLHIYRHYHNKMLAGKNHRKRPKCRIRQEGRQCEFLRGVENVSSFRILLLNMLKIVSFTVLF